LPDPGRARISSHPKPVHPRAAVQATKSATNRSVLEGIRPFRELLADWNARRRNRFPSAAAPTARTAKSVILRERPKGALHPNGRRERFISSERGTGGALFGGKNLLVSLDRWIGRD